jgi:hypothetical protein
LGAAASVVALHISSQAEACSCGLSNAIQKSLPEDGAQAVPTDVVIWAAGPEVELLDEDGEVVPSHLEQLSWRLCDGTLLLTPDAALEPDSTYTLRAIPRTEGEILDDGPTEISFTTGEGPLAGMAPEKPSVRIAAFDAANYLNSCVYSKSQVCMQATADGLIDVRFMANETERHFVGYPDMLENLELGDEAEQTCIQVQARDLAGRLSETTEMCVDFSSAPVLGEWDSSLYADCNDEGLSSLYVSSDDPEHGGDGDGETNPVIQPGGEPSGGAGSVTNSPFDEDQRVSKQPGCSITSSVGTERSNPYGFGLIATLFAFFLRARRPIRRRATLSRRRAG